MTGRDLDAIAWDLACEAEDAFEDALDVIEDGFCLGADLASRPLTPAEFRAGDDGTSAFAFGWRLGRAEAERDLGVFNDLTADELFDL